MFIKDHQWFLTRYPHFMEERAVTQIMKVRWRSRVGVSGYSYVASTFDILCRVWKDLWVNKEHFFFHILNDAILFATSQTKNAFRKPVSRKKCLKRSPIFWYFTDEGIDQQLSPTESEENLDIQPDEPSEPESTLIDGVRIKTEPETTTPEDEEEEGGLRVTPCENGTELPSPKRKINGEVQHDEIDTLRLHSKIPRTSESPNVGRKIHPDPLGLLIRAFPSQCRSVLELVLQGCGGNVVQAIECLLQNQEKKQLPLPMPVPVIGSVGGPPATIHPALHFQAPPLFRKPEPFSHTFHRPPMSPSCPFPPPPPLLKPKAQASGYPFSMDAVLGSPPNNMNASSSSPKTEGKSVAVHFCTKCGRKASCEDNFCAFCGQKLHK